MFKGHYSIWQNATQSTTLTSSCDKYDVYFVDISDRLLNNIKNHIIYYHQKATDFYNQKGVGCLVYFINNIESAYKKLDCTSLHYYTVVELEKILEPGLATTDFIHNIVNMGRNTMNGFWVLVMAIQSPEAMTVIYNKNAYIGLDTAVTSSATSADAEPESVKPIIFKVCMNHDKDECKTYCKKFITKTIKSKCRKCSKEYCTRECRKHDEKMHLLICGKQDTQYTVNQSAINKNASNPVTFLTHLVSKIHEPQIPIMDGNGNNISVSNSGSTSAVDSPRSWLNDSPRDTNVTAWNDAEGELHKELSIYMSAPTSPHATLQRRLGSPHMLSPRVNRSRPSSPKIVHRFASATYDASSVVVEPLHKSMSNIDAPIIPKLDIVVQEEPPAGSITMREHAVSTPRRNRSLSTSNSPRYVLSPRNKVMTPREIATMNETFNNRPNSPVGGGVVLEGRYEFHSGVHITVDVTS